MTKFGYYLLFYVKKNKKYLLAFITHIVFNCEPGNYISFETNHCNLLCSRFPLSLFN